MQYKWKWQRLKAEEMLKKILNGSLNLLIITALAAFIATSVYKKIPSVDRFLGEKGTDFWAIGLLMSFIFSGLFGSVFLKEFNVYIIHEKNKTQI